ncbi:FecR family protein [Steroidobacter flavus]|uniref:FecR family protein n=1 Tax=Steroidobacter flavus TaxID=1842136 RepID=A0ABV8T1Z3_9GAMM
MIAPKFSRAELRRRLKAADLAIQSQEGTLSASERLACRQWRSLPENEQTFREMAALLRAAKKLPRSHRKSRAPRRLLRDSIALKAVAGIAGVGILCGLLAFPPTVGSQQQLVNQSTQWHADSLDDGSGVFLGPGTALNFQVNDDERKVAFKHGQALFKVKKDAKPFVVRAGDISVVAVGTEFAVKLLDGPPEVTVKEGTVRVEPGRGQGQPIYVNKGEQLTIAEGTRLAVRKVNVDDQLQWTEGLWNFNGKTVAQVVAELNRHNFVQIDIDETVLPADTVIYGTVKLDDPITFVQSLALERKLIIDRRQPNVLLVTAAKAHAQ